MGRGTWFVLFVEGVPVNEIDHRDLINYIGFLEDKILSENPDGDEEIERYLEELLQVITQSTMSF